MQIRLAAVSFAFVVVLSTPFAMVSALGVEADLMCDPYFAQCPCNYVPDQKNPKECVYKAPTKTEDGKIKLSNTHACSVGICQDVTNKFRVRGICIEKYKCEAVLCEGNPGVFSSCSQTQFDALDSAYNPQFKTNFILSPTEGNGNVTPINFENIQPSTINKTLNNTFTTDPMGSEGDPIYNTNTGPSAVDQISQIGNQQPNTDVGTQQGSIVGDPKQYQIGNPKFLEPGTAGNPSNSVSQNPTLGGQLTGFASGNPTSELTNSFDSVIAATREWAQDFQADVKSGLQGVSETLQEMRQDLTSCMSESCVGGEKFAEANQKIRTELNRAATAICEVKGCDPALLENSLAGVGTVESKLQSNICSSSGTYCGVGQQGKAQTAESLDRLVRLSKNPDLSPESRAYIQDVIESIKTDTSTGYGYKWVQMDPKNSTWLYAGYALPSVDKALDYGQGDALKTASYFQTAQFAPSINSKDLNMPLSDSQIYFINNNLKNGNDTSLLLPYGGTANTGDALVAVRARFGTTFNSGINSQIAFVDNNSQTLFASNGSSILPASTFVNAPTAGGSGAFDLGGGAAFNPITLSEFDKPAPFQYYEYLGAEAATTPTPIKGLIGNQFALDTLQQGTLDAYIPIPDGEQYALRDQAANAGQDAQSKGLWEQFKETFFPKKPELTPEQKIENAEILLGQYQANPNGPGSIEGTIRLDKLAAEAELRNGIIDKISQLPEDANQWTGLQERTYNNLIESKAKIENQIIDGQMEFSKDLIKMDSQKLAQFSKDIHANIDEIGYLPDTKDAYGQYLYARATAADGLIALRQANEGNTPSNDQLYAAMKQWNGFSNPPDTSIVPASTYVPTGGLNVNPRWDQLGGSPITDNVVGITSPGLFTSYPPVDVSKLLNLPTGYQSDFTNPAEIIRSDQRNISSWWQLNTPVTSINTPAQMPFSQPTITALTMPTQGAANQLTSMLMNANNFAGLNGMGGMGGFSLPSLPSVSGSGGSKSGGSSSSPPPASPPPTTVSPPPPQTPATSTPVRTMAGTIGIPNPWKGQDYKLGDDSQDIRILQKFLNSHGALISPDGPGSQGNESTYFGEKTVAALKVFQKAQSLPETGALDVATRNRIGVISQQEETAAANSK